MKHHLSLITNTALFVLFCNSLCFAQTYSSNSDKTNIRFGIKGGANFSSLYTEDDNSNSSNLRSGFNAGLYAKMPITKWIAVQPELYYTTKGSEVTYNNSFAEGTARFNLNYVELPVLVVVNLSKNFNVHAGPYVGYLLKGNVTNESTIRLFDFEENINRDDYNRLDAGLVAGIGLDIGAIGLGARYSYGLTRVGKERSFLGTTYTFPDAKNSVLNFYISLSLN